MIGQTNKCILVLRYIYIEIVISTKYEKDLSFLHFSIYDEQIGLKYKSRK